MFTCIDDLMPKSAFPQMRGISHDDHVSFGASNCHIDSSRGFDKPHVVGSHATQEDHLLLRALEGIHGGDLLHSVA